LNFSGARGVVLWGWEPKANGQPYHQLPLYLRSLSRVATSTTSVTCGQQTLTLELRGRHTEIYQLTNGKAERVEMGE